MSREIFFHGKRIDNGEWVEGYYLTNPEWDRKDFGEHHFIVSCKNGIRYEVIPSTVGQYTGLTDQNGKRIFEGDVVRYTERMFDGSDVPVAQVVEYSEGGFATSSYFLNNWLWDGAKGNTQLRDIEVIGNINDNPELLKEEPT